MVDTKFIKILLVFLKTDLENLFFFLDFNFFSLKKICIWSELSISEKNQNFGEEEYNEFLSDAEKFSLLKYYVSS